MAWLDVPRNPGGRRASRVKYAKKANRVRARELARELDAIEAAARLRRARVASLDALTASAHRRQADALATALGWAAMWIARNIAAPSIVALLTVAAIAAVG